MSKKEAALLGLKVRSDDSPDKEVEFIIVDNENASDPKEGADPIPVDMKSEKEIYWDLATQEKNPPKSEPPTLIIMYGPPGCGKSWVLKHFAEKHDLSNYVHLDPDILRVCSKEYRMCLSGAHAANLISVKQEYGSHMVPKKLIFELGSNTWTENGFAVDGKHLALASSATRSQAVVRQGMLWGYKVQEMTDAFTDRAFKAGYNIIYDTPGNEPNRFIQTMLERARRMHKNYKVVVVGAFAPHEECVARCIHRAQKTGRYVSEAFMTRNYDIIFPNRECDLVHFNKFEQELNEGDKRYLYDNSIANELPLLFKEDTIRRSQLQRTSSEQLNLDTMKANKDKEKDEKSSKAESSRQMVKKLVQDLEIYTNVLKDLKYELQLMELSKELDEETSPWKGRESKDQAQKTMEDKETQIEETQNQLCGLMNKLGENEPYVLACGALFAIIERLEDQNSRMREAADFALDKIKNLKTNLLDAKEYVGLAKALGMLPMKIFTNMADQDLLSYTARRQLCRVPAVCISLVQDIKDGAWLLNRLSHGPDKAETAVEYFEALADLRKLMGTDERRLKELDWFYRKLGTQLAIPEVRSGSSKARVLTLFPTLYAMKEPSHRVQIIDSLVGTPVLTTPLNILIGQSCAFTVLILDFCAIAWLLFSTYRVGIKVAHHHRRVTQVPEPIQHDLVLVYVSSFYVLLREISSLIAFHRLGRDTMMGGEPTITVWTYLKNKWKLLNIVSALSTLAFCVVASSYEFVDWQITLASWTVGMLWLRLLGYIRTLNINFATYITCLLQILVDISSFLIIMLIVMLMFGSMIFLNNVESAYESIAFAASWDVEEELKVSKEAQGANDFDMHPFLTSWETLLSMFRILLGETHRYWFHSPMEIGLYVSYELVVVILMLNVLIAVVGDSYEYSIIRARTTFLETRVELVVELETLGMTNPSPDTIPGLVNHTLRKWNHKVSRFWSHTFSWLSGRDVPQEGAAPIRKTTLGIKTARVNQNMEGYRRLSSVQSHDLEPEVDDEDSIPLHQEDKGLLGLLQWSFRVENETFSLRNMNTADSWLGRALDMERRTQKIVSMSEVNLEDSLVRRVEHMQREQQALAKKVDQMIDGVSRLVELKA